MKELRDYQQSGIEKLRASIRAGNKRIILQSPTGSGKGVIISQMLQNAHDAGKSVLFLVHKREIIHQVSIHLGLIPHGIIMAGEKMNLSHRIQLASKDTLIRRDIDLGQPSLVIIDEAHRATANQYSKLIEQFPDAIVVGFTATPARQSGKGLGTFFTDMIQLTTVRDLTDRGFLAPAIYVAPPKIDISKLKVVGGDYTAASVGGAVKPILGDVLDTFIKFALDRQTVIFVPRVENAVEMEKQFQGAGIETRHICGKTGLEERKEISAKFMSGEVQVVVNVGVFVEGIDIPNISCVILATATKSIVRYLQMIGRGLRAGKEDCLVIDHGLNIYQHGKADENFDWSLDKGGQPPEPKEKVDKPSKEKKEKEDRVCGSCWTIWSGGGSCPSCGEAAGQRGKTLESVKAEMGFVDKVTKPKKPEKSARQALWNKFLYQGGNLNHTCGQAACRYKQSTGKWPKGLDRMPLGDQWKMKIKDFLVAHRNAGHRAAAFDREEC